MSEKIKVINRMLDVALALNAARTHEQYLNRTQLQKYIYLIDSLSIIYEFLPPKSGHITYNYGPYDKAIQNAVDSLAFRGFIKIQNIKKLDGENLNTQYGLSASGLNFIKKLINNKAFQIRNLATLDIGKKINFFGWNKLVDLVYAEPTFINAKPKGPGQELNPEDMQKTSSAFLINIFKQVLNQGAEDFVPDRKLILELFFRYLNEYSLIASQTNLGNPNS